MLLKYSQYTLFIILLVIGACNSPSKQKTTKEIKSDKVEISYLPEFPEPNRAEILLKQRQIHSFFNDNMDPRHFNGQFLVAKNGKVIYLKASGFSNIRKKIEMTTSTPMHVASVSKVATALAILRLVGKKQIFLDSDVRWYLPELPYEGITVRMLLNHRSGIQYYGFFTYRIWPLGKTLYNQDILNLLKKYKFPLNFPPNRKFSYSNTNYALLALIIEKVTKKSFPRAMDELVFLPLKMKNTFIMDKKRDPNEVTQSYDSGRRLEKFDYLDAVYGDKNMYTTAQDLLQMDKGTYSELFLNDSLRQQMFKGYSYEHAGKSNYGLGMRMKEVPGKNTYYFHSGWWHGNTACYATLRADTVCIIALSNVYTQNVWRVNKLSMAFGNYPFQFNFD